MAKNLSTANDQERTSQLRVCQIFCVTGRDGFHLMWSAILSP